MLSQELILVVDDELEVRDLIAEILSRDGYIVKTAADGRQAIEMLGDHLFSLVITDLMMPVITGLEVLAEVKQKLPSAEVILITANGSLQSAIAALRHGAYDYLSKPFETDGLRHSVQQALAYRRLKLEKSELLTNLQKQRDELSHILAASNSLTRLNLQADSLIPEIVELGERYLNFRLALTVLDRRGEFQEMNISPAFPTAWAKFLQSHKISKEIYQALSDYAPRLNQSYLIEFRPNLVEQIFHVDYVDYVDPVDLDKPEGELEPRPGPLLVIPLETHEGQQQIILWVAGVEQPLKLEVVQGLEIFANQVAGTLGNAALFAARSRQVRTRNALVEAGQRIATLLDQQEVLQTILEATFKVIPNVELVVMYHRLTLDGDLLVAGLDSRGKMTTTSPLAESLVAKVLQDKQGLHLPRWSNSLTETKYSLIIEPLTLANISLGALAVIGTGAEVFENDYQQLLAMLANEATIALQNARLYTEARRVDELEALYEAGRAINRTLDLQQTLITTMAIARSLTGASVGNIYLYRPDNEYYQIDSLVTLDGGFPLTDADRRRSAQITQEVMRTHRPSLVLTSTELVPQSNPDQPDSDKFNIQAWLAVPLLTDETPLAVLALGSDRPNIFTSNDVRLMQIVAAQATAAIENARLYEEVQQRLQQNEALNEISQSINTTLDLHRVLELVVQSAAKTIPVATHSMLYLLDKGDKPSVFEAKITSKQEVSPPEIEQVRHEAIQQATQQNDTIRVSWHSETHGPWSLLIAPLKIMESVIGAICIESPRLDGFLSSDETLLNTFASHASLAIQNANLFNDLSSTYLDLAKKQEEILRSHRILQALFDSITDGLYIVDQNLQVIVINQAEAKRLGRTPESLIGQRCDSSLWGEAWPALSKIVGDTFKTGEEKFWESQLGVAHRGAFADRDVRTYPIFEESKQVNQVIIFAQDISEKRRLQASLFRSANLAAVGQLASSIAHQINNPLTVIIANAQIMEMDGDPASPDYPILTHIVEAGLQIRQIVQNLLDFSTQESYDWFETDVEDTIDDALKLVAYSLRKSNIEVNKEIDKLPIIVASANHLKLLWMNLLRNAHDAVLAQAQQAEGEEVFEGVIKIFASQKDAEHICIQIVDNGIGLSSDHKNRLFHPFFTTKLDGKNLGLGLYTCRAIIESHRGEIEIEPCSALPEGSTKVIVTLPIHHPA